MTPAEKKPESNDALRDSLRQRLEADTALPETKEKIPAPSPQASPPPPQSGKNFKEVLNMNLSIGGPGLAQMTAFCRQLATLVGVGIPLVQSLTTVAKRTEHPELKKIVADVARRVEEGGSFSEALQAHPKTFSSLVINVVRIGESAGILEGALEYLAEIMERRSELRRKVMAALSYPIAAIIVCGLVIMVILGFAIPVFGEVYANANVDLPGITTFVLNLGNFVAIYWWLIIAAVAILVFGLRHLIGSNTETRLAWDMLCLKTPIVRLISLKVNVARTARTMANLLKAGIPLLEALIITAETSENTVVAKMLKDTHDNLEQGGRLIDPLRKANIFPALVIDMIAIGDEAGRLDVMFDKIAETYDSDVTQSISALNSIIEPMLIVIMGGIVLVLALAVLLPYWDIADAVAE